MRLETIKPAALLKAATISGLDAVGGVSAASRLLGIGTPALTKYASTAEEWQANFIRVDLAVRLDVAAGHPFLTNAMTHIVQAAEPEAPGALTASAILKLDGVLDDVVREVAAALEDGHLDAAERQAVRSRIVAAHQSLSRLDAMMSRGLA